MISDTGRIKTHRTRMSGPRIVRAVHGLRSVEAHPQFALDMAAHLRERLPREQLLRGTGRENMAIRST